VVGISRRGGKAAAPPGRHRKRCRRRVRRFNSCRGHLRGAGFRRRGGKAATPPSRYRKRCL